MSDIKDVIDDIFYAAESRISNILPSEWAEQNRFMTSDVSTMEGMFRFDNSPYTREILDCLAPDHPARIIAIKKGSQLGFSTSVLENGIGWIMCENPGNILFLVGHESLVEDAVKKVDVMIDNSGIRQRNIIRAAANRSRKTKSGDTNAKKEFSGGELKFGIANHKYLRNISMRYGFIDDYEAMKSDTKESGDTLSMIRARFKAYIKKMKLYLISSPERLETSNIEPAYLKGDQRKWHVPCPCCGEHIVWEWEVDSKCQPGEKAGITWQVDEKLKLIPGSVGYICQECGGFFDDRNKTEMILSGHYRPTAPDHTDPEYVSYHLSALYAPIYMQGWTDYVKDYLEANPPGGKRDEKKHQTFVNQCLGECYEPQGESISAESLQMNIRTYEVGTIPEKLSIQDGNGKIVFITLGSDMNGTEDDARLDYEIVGWSEAGASYSIDHGSIGTFIPKENQLSYKVDRRPWTYRRGGEYNVWDELDRIMETKLVTDTGRRMVIFAGCLDSGYLATSYAYPYLDSTNNNVFGVKGAKEAGSGLHIDADHRSFKPALERGKLWILQVNQIKDVLSTYMNQTWDPRIHKIQPSGFMNFPTPSDGKYLLHNYFIHFEAEHKIIGNDNRFIWKKKQSHLQNHLYDCRIYAMAARDIMVEQLFQAMKVKNGVWSDFVAILLDANKG